jgi:uncharacterized protein (DUF169 family)
LKVGGIFKNNEKHKEENMDLKEVNAALSQYIRPQTFPVAYKLVRSEDELPERVKMPMRDLGYPITLCQATGLTRRYGWTMALGKEDQCCVGGAQTMGFVPESVSGPVGTDKRHEPGKYKYHVTAALERTNFEPDVITVYGNSAQIMRLVQSAIGGYNGEGKVNTVATGYFDCADIAAGTVLSDECQAILPSGGDRVFGATQDHEMIFAMPWSKVQTVIKGLASTHKAGFRYPVVSDIRHRPNLPPFLEIPESA